MATAAQHEAPYLNSRDIKVFDQRVIRMLTSLVNDYGVGYRLLDGGHILLRGLDGESSLKVSSSRKAEASMGYIEKFTRQSVTPYLVENQVQALAAQFNDPTKKPHRKAPVQTATKPTPTPPPVEKPVVPAEPKPVTIEPDTVEGEWSLYYTERRGVKTATRWLVHSDGETYKCSICGHISHSKGGMGGHMRAHSDKAKVASAKQGRAAHIQHLLTKLAKACEVELAVNSDAQTRRVARLEAELDKVTKERDDLKARLDLMREAMRA